jgi:hypothetical protein
MSLMEEKVEDKIVNAGSGATVILQEIKVGLSSIIEGDNLTIDDTAVWQIAESFDNIGILSVKGLLAPRKQIDTIARLDRDGAVAIEFDLVNPLRPVAEFSYRLALHWFDEVRSLHNLILACGLLRG